MSLIGALTHLGKVPRYRKLWVQSVVGYTWAGLLSAATVGAVLGGLGRWVVAPLPVEARFFILTLLLLMLVARELGWISFPLPVRHRQTEKTWANQFGFRAAAVMWGFHIGTGFSTRVNYGGFWAVVGVIVAVGDARYGATLMGSYWLGRVLPIWFSPWISGTSWDGVTLLTGVQSQGPMYRNLSVLGLAWSAGIGMLMTPGRGARMTWIIDGVSALGWLYISYILICGLALIPALLLHKVLRELVWLLRQRDDLRKQRSIARSGPVPQFSAPVLGTEKTFTSRDLTGRETMLMFVRPEDGVCELDKQLPTSVHALFHKAKGNFYILCSGSTEGCRQLLPEVRSSGHEIPVLLDEDGTIARTFHVNRTPVAFRLDAEARIVSFGQQRSSADH